jgi:hypothetical protein
VNNVAPSVGPITAPIEPVHVGIEITTTASFTDPGILDTHTALWDWGDDSTSNGTVTETGGSGEVTGFHVYDTPGVYTITLDVTDKDGGMGSGQFQYVVVYDSFGGFVTGSGWIASPEGAYTADPSLVGDGKFGFVSKYQKGASIPTGQTSFRFKVADLDFDSETYEWLVVAGAKAQYKGTGTINTEGSYKFMLKAFDADVNENDNLETDLFRIKIWSEDQNGDEVVIYDNGLGEDFQDENPETGMTEIIRGAIVVHRE